MLPATHYQHSGAAPPGGVLLTLVGGLIVGVVLGSIYGFLIYWSPFVYINAFITFGFGLGLAMTVGSIAKFGKLRNATVITVLALMVAVVAYCVHWSVWVDRLMEGAGLTPAETWSMIPTINALGPWAIFGWTPTGVALWGIWGIEALVIVGLGTISAHGVTDIPFCEKTGQWTTEETLAGRFAPTTEMSTVSSPGSMLQSLRSLEGAADFYTEVTVATAEGSELRCVSLDNVAVETDKDGKEEAKKTNIVKNMLFDRESFEKLLQMGQGQTHPEAQAGVHAAVG